MSVLLAARPATAVISVSAVAVVLTLVLADVGGSSIAAASARTSRGSVSGAVIPVAARKPSPSLQGAQPLRPAGSAVGIPSGRITFINFWASWCTPCQQEAPDLSRFTRTLPSNVAFVGVDVNDRASNALTFMRRYGLHYPMLSDPDGTLLRRFNGAGLPTTVVVDQHGRVADVLFGPQTTASLHGVLHTLQAQR